MQKVSYDLSFKNHLTTCGYHTITPYIQKVSDSSDREPQIWRGLDNLPCASDK